MKIEIHDQEIVLIPESTVDRALAEAALVILGVESPRRTTCVKLTKTSMINKGDVLTLKAIWRKDGSEEA